MCNNAGDSIRIFVVNSESGVKIAEDIVNYSNIGIQKRWQKRSFRFQTQTNDNIDVIDRFCKLFFSFSENFVPKIKKKHFLGSEIGIIRVWNR